MIRKGVIIDDYPTQQIVDCKIGFVISTNFQSIVQCTLSATWFTTQYYFKKNFWIMHKQLTLASTNSS